MTSRLALGTVQFGLNYGIANSDGIVEFETAQAIVGAGWSAGIDTLDTAIAYGTSEQTLGRIGVKSHHVVSKLSSVPPDVADLGWWVRSQLEQSLERLDISTMFGLLLHNPGQLRDERGETLYRALRDCQDAGLVRRIGYSIYDPGELDALFAPYPPDIVQAPLNILDRRLVDSGWLARLNGSGVVVHTRSAFLQGLLLMPPATRPPIFSRWNDLWGRWQRVLDETHMTPLEACLGFVLGHAGIDKVVVGADSPTHLEQILKASNRPPSNDIPDNLSSIDRDLIEPSNWSRL